MVFKKNNVTATQGALVALLQQQYAKFNAESNTKKLIVFLLGVLLLWIVWLVFVSWPISARLEKQQTSLKTTELRTKQLNTSLTKMEKDAEIDYTQALKKIDKAIAEAKHDTKALPIEAFSNAQFNQLLAKVSHYNRGLRILSVTQEQKGGFKRLHVTFEGTYNATYQFLNWLNTLEFKPLFDQITYKVTQHPLAETDLVFAVKSRGS